MATITIDVPDDLFEQLDQLRDRLPELLALSLQQPALPAAFYRSILAFLATRPSSEQVIGFQPSAMIHERVRTLLARSHAGQLSALEHTELDEFERIDHFMVMLKIGQLPDRAAAR